MSIQVLGQFDALVPGEASPQVGGQGMVMIADRPADASAFAWASIAR
jgi:hypothetical protein